MKCQYCGSDLPENAKICTVCGAVASGSSDTIYANGSDNDFGQSFSNQQNNFGQQPFPSQQNDFGQQPFPNQQNNFGQQPFPNQQNDFGQQSFPNQQNGFGQQMVSVQPNLTKKQLADVPALAAWKKNFKVTYIIGYVCSALMLIGLYTVGTAALIDVGILLGTTLGVHLKYSKGCAVAMLVYSIINMIIGLVSNGMLSGWLILATAICAVKFTFEFDKYWKSYMSTGTVPFVVPKGRR